MEFRNKIRIKSLNFVACFAWETDFFLFFSYFITPQAFFYRFSTKQTFIKNLKKAFKIVMNLKVFC